MGVPILFLFNFMAIYSCNHSSIGRSTQKREYTASAHINYITRVSATTEIVADGMPKDRFEASKWMREQEQAERYKNARIIDKVMVALPVELTHEQHVTLVKDYAREMTGGRCPWFAVIHSREKDVHNPHAHIVFRDRDFENGKRTMMTTSKGSTYRFREAWEHICNTHLAMNGHEARIDRRTLKEQGIDREPQIHIGPKANAAVKRGAKIVSKDRIVKRNGKKREVRYTEIDKLKKEELRTATRRDFNENIIDLNLERLRRSDNHELKLKADFEAQGRQQNIRFAIRRDDMRRAYRQEAGKLWKDYQKKYEEIKSARKKEKKELIDELKAEFKPLWSEHFEAKNKAFKKLELEDKQPAERLAQLKRSLPHIWSQLEPTQELARGKLSALFKQADTKPERDEMMKAHYRKEHQALYKSYNRYKNIIGQAVDRKYDPEFEKIKKDWQDERRFLQRGNLSRWKEYYRDYNAYKEDREKERSNLSGFIAGYYNQQSGGSERGEQTGLSKAQKLAEEIRQREQTQRQTGGKGRDR